MNVQTVQTVEDCLQSVCKLHGQCIDHSVVSACTDHHHGYASRQYFQGLQLFITDGLLKAGSPVDQAWTAFVLRLHVC